MCWITLYTLNPEILLKQEKYIHKLIQLVLMCIYIQQNQDTYKNRGNEGGKKSYIIRDLCKEEKLSRRFMPQLCILHTIAAGAHFALSPSSRLFPLI